MKYCLWKKSGQPVDFEKFRISPFFPKGFIHLGWFSGCLPSTVVATPGFQSPDVAVDLKPHSLWPSCTFPATQHKSNTTQHESIPTNNYNHNHNHNHHKNNTNTAIPTQRNTNSRQHQTPEPSKPFIQAPGTSTMPVRRDQGPHQITPWLSWSSSWCHLILILMQDEGWIYPPKTGW